MEGRSQRRTSLTRALRTAAAILAVLTTCGAPAAAASRQLTGSLRGRDAAAILRAGRASVRLSGPAGVRVRVGLTLSSTGTSRRGRRALAAGVPAAGPRRVQLSRRGRAMVALALNA